MPNPSSRPPLNIDARTLAPSTGSKYRCPVPPNPSALRPARLTRALPVQSREGNGVSRSKAVGRDSA
eukprot:scaffold24985_cov118-Isochrysis_galbana.AAC.2